MNEPMTVLVEKQSGCMEAVNNDLISNLTSGRAPLYRKATEQESVDYWQWLDEQDARMRIVELSF